MRKAFGTTGMILLLASCAPQQMPTEVMQGPAPPGANLFAPPAPVPPPGAGAIGNAQVATQVAGPTTYLAPMPTALVILKDPQGDPKQISRNQAFCQSFVTKIPPLSAQIAGSVLAENVIDTRWLLDSKQATSDDIKSCAFLLAHYDYQRAGMLMGGIPLPVSSSKPASWANAGPFVVELFPDNHVAVADASGIETSFDSFLQGWQRVAQAQQLVAEGAQPSTVASVATGGTPTPAATNAATKATSAASSTGVGLAKDLFTAFKDLAELIPEVGTAVKVVTTVVGTVCSVVGSGSG